MCNGDDLDDGVELAVNHGKGELAEKIATGSVRVFGPATRILGYLLNGVVDFGYESLRCTLATGLVPLPCGSRFLNGLRVEDHRTRGH